MAVETAVEQTVVLLGNPAPHMQVKFREEDPQAKDGFREVVRAVPAQHISQSVTRSEMWPGFDDEEFVTRSLSTNNDRILTMIAHGLPAEQKRYAVGISEIELALTAHSGGAAPEWVASSDPEFAKAIGQHFGCPVTDFTENEDGTQIGGPTALIPNAGRDAMHAQVMSTSAPPATFNYMALANSATATAPASGDTTLVGEITTAGGGLLRGQATYSHTAGTNSTTLTKTFTANGTDVLPVTVSQTGVFNAAASGTLGMKTPLTSNATLNVSGDNVTVQETVNIG